MILKSEFTDDALAVHVTVRRWLVRNPNSSYSVAQLENGHLIVVGDLNLCDGNGNEGLACLEIYEYADLDAMSEYGDIPHAELRATAHALGITHIEHDGKQRAVDEWFGGDRDET